MGLAPGKVRHQLGRLGAPIIVSTVPVVIDAPAVAAGQADRDAARGESVAAQAQSGRGWWPRCILFVAHGSGRLDTATPGSLMGVPDGC
jgi:hypothetical protein